MWRSRPSATALISMPGNDLESERRGVGARLVDAGGRVVIGDADDGQAGGVRGATSSAGARLPSEAVV